MNRTRTLMLMAGGLGLALLALPSPVWAQSPFGAIYTQCPGDGNGNSIPDIQERGTMGPLPPRGDVAIPSHRILRGDNTVAPTPPAGAPAGIEKPGEPPPAGTGGY